MRKLTANVVQETTATIGTGTLALSQSAGWMRFSDRFVAGDTVYYSIRDGNNWEVGKGTVGAANTLLRTTVLETLVGGVVAVAGPAMVLASGSAIVRAVVPEELFSTVLKVETVLTAVNVNPAVDGFSYGVTVANVTLTLNAAPSVGDRIQFFQAFAGDVNGLAQCIVDPNGGKINNTVGAMTVDVPNFSFFLTYVSAGYGWKVD